MTTTKTEIIPVTADDGTALNLHHRRLPDVVR